MSIWLSTNVYCWLLGFMRMILDEKHSEEKGRELFNIFFDRHPHLSQMVLEGQRRRARQPLLDWCKSSDTKCWKTYQRRLSARNGNVRTSVYMICFQRNSDFVAKSEILKGANRAQQFNCDRHTQQMQCPNLDTISRKQNLQETTATPITSLIQKPAGHPSRNSNVWMDRTLDPPGFILSLIGHFGTPIRVLPRTENRVTAIFVQLRLEPIFDGKFRELILHDTQWHKMRVPD